MANGLRFKGTVSVELDASALQARLTLRREGDLEYDEGAITRILSDAGVTSGFDLDEVVAAIQAYQKTKDPSRTVLAAQGKAPEPPQGETWVWSEDLPALTGEDQALAARVLKAAGPPEIFQVRVEKVKVEKTVAGKAGLFGTAAPEVQTVVENREVRSKVLVDPNPLKVHRVEAGAVVAKVLPPKAGVPGLDLAGKVLPPPPARAAAFLTGRGLTRGKAEVMATESGFLRVGRTWADVVPYRSVRWELTYSADKTNAYLTLEPGQPGEPGPAAADVVARLRADGYPEALLPAEAEVQVLVDGALGAGVALVAHPLTKDRDGSFTIQYTADHAQATLDLHKPLGRGSPLSLKDLGAALKEASLRGFSFEAVKGALQAFLTGPQTELLGFGLATGESPVADQDQTLHWLVPLLPDEELDELRGSSPEAEGLGPANLSLAAPVQAGAVVARLQTPEGGAGKPGLDVHGNPIPAPAGQEPALVLLGGLVREGAGLKALSDGLLEAGEHEGRLLLRVRLHSDALAAVTRSDDNMTATLTLTQGRGGGRRLDRALVDRALNAAQIGHGLDEAAVSKALEAAQAGQKVEGWVIARGTPAGNDFARRLEFAQPPRSDAEGRKRLAVKAGEVGVSYRLPTPDQIDGTDVLGNPVPSSDMEVRNLSVSEDFEVETDENGLQMLRALKGGDLLFDGESITLITQIAVAAAGGKAGNVKFNGEVLVAGGVESGGYVMAGNLKVKGRVGGALLSSDHNIQVADGIHGEGKAVLRAKKHVSVGFVEKALVMAVGDVHVGKTALGCTFRVNGKIFQKSPGGGLQGGLTKVRLGLDVMNLGSPSGVPTVVSFGQDYLIEDQIKAEVKETDKLRDDIIQLDLLMRKLSGPAHRDRLDAARQKKVLMMKLLDKRNLKLIHLRDKFELHVPSEIVVRETLFPGVSIESHGRVYEPGSRKTALRLVFNEQTGHIEEFPLT